MAFGRPAARPHSYSLLPAVLVSFALTGGATHRTWAVEHNHGSTAPTATAEGTTAPLYTPDDLMFLTHMIVHHQQALDMAALVPSRTHREEFIRFARYIAGAQHAEIDQMNSLLRAAAERGLEAPHHDMSGDPPMHGMLSKAQMADLAAVRDAPFEKLWLEGMIYHHQAALDMGRAQQERQFATGRHPYGIDTLVDDILVAQRGEITRMRSWLVQWGLVGAATGA